MINGLWTVTYLLFLKGKTNKIHDLDDSLATIALTDGEFKFQLSAQNRKFE